VTEQVLHQLRMHACLQSNGRPGVSQVVHADLRVRPARRSAALAGRSTLQRLLDS
jgi:hypothetical protein